jgi:small GTP-binding protein
MGCETSVAPEPARTVTFVGLDGSGKSHIISRILSPNSGNLHTPIPTAGVSFHQTKNQGVTLRIFDCGGLGRYREQWLAFVNQSDSVVFVIDRADTARMGRVREEIADIIKKCAAAAIPLLILVNKCDLESPLEPTDILKITKVEEADITFAIRQCSATNSHGIESVTEWMRNPTKSKPVEHPNPSAVTSASAVAPPDDDSSTE